ncbi:hypothetical protein BB31_39615 [Amycolatopsis lurida NRRL 2430]|uniref:Uncharacterized protein n=1 Tax=Amycolatopsis lurida NRRL 2430 TaxID=1460371 RepID=A0A2P2FGJ7_AMYLU|nr:hypothetical protein BB31_39615 [Amycolatopsis lurida NRRL 2430]
MSATLVSTGLVRSKVSSSAANRAGDKPTCLLRRRNVPISPLPLTATPTSSINPQPMLVAGSPRAARQRARPSRNSLAVE